MSKIKQVISDKNKPTYFSMLHYWMKKKFPKGVFLVKIYTDSMQDLMHYPTVFEGFKDYDEAFDYIEEKGLLDHESYILKIYVDGKKSEEGDSLIEGKIPVGSKRYVCIGVETKVKNKKGKYDFVETYDSDTPTGKSCYIVFPDKSYITLISFDDVNLSYNAMDKHWGMAENWKKTKKSQLKKDIISEARHVSEYTNQHQEEFKEFSKEHLLSYVDLLEITAIPVQECINKHMEHKGLSDDRDDPDRIKEVKFLKEGSPEGWNYCLESEDIIKLILKKAPIEEFYSLLKNKYIVNLVKL